jgi:hypothetical protein
MNCRRLMAFPDFGRSLPRRRAARQFDVAVGSNPVLRHDPRHFRLTANSGISSAAARCRSRAKTRPPVTADGSPDGDPKDSRVVRPPGAGVGPGRPSTLPLFGVEYPPKGQRHDQAGRRI